MAAAEKETVRVVRLVLAGVLSALLTVPAAVPVAAVTEDPAETTLTADLPTGTVKTGDRVEPATGTVSGPAARKVRLQARTAGGWLTLTEQASANDGSFTLPVPTWWVRKQVLRVFVPPTADHAAAATATSTVTVTRRYTPRRGTAYRHLGGVKARWDPCRTITYRVNPQRMPHGALVDVRQAVMRVSEATGLRFAYAGTTSFVPYRRGATRGLVGADVAVAWASPRLVPSLAGRVLGQGGYAAFNGRDWDRIAHGYVVLDSTERLAGGFAGKRTSRGLLLLHELGHTLGLDHVGDSAQVMYPTLLPRVAEYASGDLRGLAAVGASRGCFADGGSARFTTRRPADPVLRSAA